jgi:hypothetical protein
MLLAKAYEAAPIDGAVIGLLSSLNVMDVGRFWLYGVGLHALDARSRVPQHAHRAIGRRQLVGACNKVACANWTATFDADGPQDQVKGRDHAEPLGAPLLAEIPAQAVAPPSTSASCHPQKADISAFGSALPTRAARSFAPIHASRSVTTSPSISNPIARRPEKRSRAPSVGAMVSCCLHIIIPPPMALAVPPWTLNAAHPYTWV